MTETTHANVYVALAAAQTEFAAPVKGSTNPAFKTRYADLANVVEAVAPALSRHGIAFAHYVESRDLGAGPEACMVTALIHGASDTRLECPVPLILAKRDMQGFKSATTYAKRIGLESVTGVAPDDDDGNDATKQPPRSDARRDPPPPPPGPDPRAEAERIIAAINAAPTLDALRETWGAVKADAGNVNAADANLGARILAARDARAAALTPPPPPPPPAPAGSLADDTIPF